MGRIQSGSICDQYIVYSPLPSQQKFHQSSARFKGFSGPVGSGKSQALCQEAIRLSYVNAGRVGLIGAPTYPMLRDTTQTALLEALEKDDIPFDFVKSENTLVLRDGNSKILFRSMEEYDRLRGTNLAWFGLDELTYTHEEAWTRLEARLRDPSATELCGFAVWTPQGYDWVYRRFIETRRSGYDVILAAPFENKYILDAVPDYYERLRTSYDENFYLQEAMGSYINTTGSLVYRSFARDVNVQRCEIDPRLPLLWSLDFNVDPMCSVVAQRRLDELWVVDEIALPGAITEEACAEFLRRYGRHQTGVRVYGDVSGYSRKTVSGTDYSVVTATLGGVFGRNLMLQVDKTNPPVAERVLMVNAKLKTAAGESSLFVSPKCEGLILDFEQVVYSENSREINKTRDRRRTHLSDALGYLVWQEFRPQQQIGEQRRRLF
jgi:Terminase large subunit, T4likevirus-type, N-terminal